MAEDVGSLGGDLYTKTDADAPSKPESGEPAYVAGDAQMASADADASAVGPDSSTAEEAERSTAESARSDDSDSSDTYTVREGVTRQIQDEDQLSVRSDVTTGESAAQAYTDAELFYRMDPQVDARPPDFREVVDVMETAPDGTAIGGSGLTGALGESISGGSQSLSGDIQGRAGALGGDALAGSKLDPLGLTDDTGGSDLGSDRQIDQALFRAGGGQLADGETDIMKWKDGTTADGRPYTDTQIKDSPNTIREYHDTGTMQFIDADGTAGAEIPLPGPEPGSGGDPSAAGGGGGGKDPADDEGGQPAPDDYDSPANLTEEQVARMVAAQGTGVYESGGRTEDETSATTTANLDWAGGDVDPRLGQYGPDGPEATAGASWTPPVDTLFDPVEGGAEAPATGGGTPEGASPAAGGSPAAPAGTADILGSSTDGGGWGGGDGGGGTDGGGDGDGGGTGPPDDGGDDASMMGGALAAGVPGGGLVSQGDEGDEDGGIQTARLDRGDVLGAGADITGIGTSETLAGGAADAGMKMDANGATIDLATGQAVGGGEAALPITVDHGLGPPRLVGDDPGAAQLGAQDWGAVSDFQTDEALAGANEGELGGLPGDEEGGFPQQPGGEG